MFPLLDLCLTVVCQMKRYPSTYSGLLLNPEGAAIPLTSTNASAGRSPGRQSNYAFIFDAYLTEPP